MRRRLALVRTSGEIGSRFRPRTLRPASVSLSLCASSQALEAGRYTIKAKRQPVFLPFEVTVKDGAATRIALGGVFTFDWSGSDCWDIFRGEELVTYHCGANKQALGAGTYTIKAKRAPVFNPLRLNCRWHRCQSAVTVTSRQPARRFDSQAQGTGRKRPCVVWGYRLDPETVERVVLGSRRGRHSRAHHGCYREAGVSARHRDSGEIETLTLDP